ncbi:MAG: hypothetical protein KatS3mg104_1829 [Phycisphaerae bacterium]|nr:MAG: hypothetical protein KatS3mg104_1829 [Phycisphaerae bacterium]
MRCRLKNLPPNPSEQIEPMMNKNTSLIVSGFLGLLLVVGCKSVNPPSRGRADITEHNKIFFSQEQRERLRESTAILGDRVDRDQFGLLTVVIPIRSAVPRTLYLEYQYAFFDSSGRQVEGPVGWLPITLEAGSPGTIQFTSTNPQAADYRCTIRFAR